MKDRWTAVEVIGAVLLAGGLWAQWGAPWAAIMIGALLLCLSAIRAVMLARGGD